jgi:diguanylate cyclase
MKQRVRELSPIIGNEGSKNMANEFHVVDVSPKFEEKVFTIADEVFKILKELSYEHKTEIQSDQIAERMFYKDSLKGLLKDIHTITQDEKLEDKRITELSNLLLDKFSDLIPAYVAAKLGRLKDALHNKTLNTNSKEWIDLPIDVIKDYIDLISVRNNELEDFLNNTVEHICITEDSMSRERSLHHQKLNDDSAFEDSIASNIDELKREIIGMNDVIDIRSVAVKKLDDLYGRVQLRRSQEMQYRQETEKTLKEMTTRISKIKRGADDIQRKSKSKEYEASHDALTEVFNRKAYEKKIEEVLADVNRYGVSASLMVCNIDQFSKINDTFGHKVGDLALKKFAALIKEQMRINDFIARYGEDVFAAILPFTDIEGAGVAGERLRAYIDNAVFGYKGHEIPLTISIGISSLRKDDNIRTVLERADSTLRLAKNAGRNILKTENEAEKELQHS